MCLTNQRLFLISASESISFTVDGVPNATCASFIALEYACCVPCWFTACNNKNRENCGFTESATCNNGCLCWPLCLGCSLFLFVLYDIPFVLFRMVCLCCLCHRVRLSIFVESFLKGYAVTRHDEDGNSVYSFHSCGSVGSGGSGCSGGSCGS